MVLHTWRYSFLSYLVLGQGVSYALDIAIFGKPDTALTSDPVYLAILFPKSFGVLAIRELILHLLVALYTW